MRAIRSSIQALLGCRSRQETGLFTPALTCVIPVAASDGFHAKETLLVNECPRVSGGGDSEPAWKSL